ncbi:Glycosyltransferase involved in cell wall bisynthesis [Lutimaribacter pacificus]|uniref:Glycosyltransferase involved in cell wall bisynthesis n=1 Tax=Lutimaribacter pacificus TaxID=391948 RepID=A0A1H0CKV5_9RHOB|nr:glycosyltransferase [Lutimaribacter pacificus]SDN58494.1 Glycosyltransferase involved in cell wall bisynthesis [Lutimaribacter pacificus]SHJ43452.1 Glycosyltransferase involved in cell wall bisynthesis [Lutimaribacter pacificus]
MTAQGTGHSGHDGAVSVVIAARNEEGYIGDCLRSLLAQDADAGAVQVIVAANACTDRTAGVAAGFAPRFAERGWQLDVIEVPEPGKPNALNAGDAAAHGGMRAFLDADVRLDPAMLGQLRAALAPDAPLYATGTLAVTRAESWVTRQYARLWVDLPFVRGGAVGAGLFAVNKAGRARWGDFPAIISDDTFVRLQFTPEERIEVPARYHWPMVEGFGNLVRVRRRQDEGVRELHRLWPGLADREAKDTLSRAQLAGLFLRKPVPFIVYALVHVAVRLKRSGTEWTRGR